jgi:hypothetical protein
MDGLSFGPTCIDIWPLQRIFARVDDLSWLRLPRAGFAALVMSVLAIAAVTEQVIDSVGNRDAIVTWRSS